MSDESKNEGQNLEQVIDQATQSVSDQAADLDEGAGEPIGIENLLDVPVRVTVQIGRTRISLGDLIALKPGALLPLDREAHEPADILVNGKIVARGEVVTIDGSYGVRISSVLK